MMPSSRLHHPVNAHVENGRLGGSARQIVNLARKRFSQRMNQCLEFTKNLSHDTKQPFWRDIGARNAPERSFYFFPLALILLLSFLFSVNYFSTPPGVCLK